MDLTRAIFSGLVLAAAVSAQGPLPGVTQDWSQVEQRVAWHGTWAAAEAAAEASGRPILLVFAAPHCSQVPGIW